VLAVALLVVVAAPVGAEPGTTHAVWQVAAWELHVIMQLVTVEVCASRIFPSAWATPNVPSVIAPSAKTPNGVTNRHMIASRAEWQTEIIS
jgi:hypothetical protein